MYTDFHVKYPLFLSDFNQSLNLSIGFSKNTQISNFMKIRPVETKLFHADGQTDRYMTKLKTTCRNFVDAPKIG